MAVVGAIADRVRGIFPITWDALSGDPRYGDGTLRTTIDTIKERVFGTVVAPAAESTYPLIVIDYVAKLVALDLIAPGIDYWMNQPSAESATGTNETHTFIDRAAALRELRQDLLRETREMAGEIGPLINFTRVTNAPRPLINTMDDPFLTPSPQEFPRPYRVTGSS